MFTNYFRIAWRNLYKNKSFAVINIAGLAVGMTCTMLILLWVNSERSWDKSQPNYDRVYHVMSNRNFNGEISTGPDMMFPLPKAAKNTFPEVQAATLVSFGETTLFAKGEKKINQRTITASADFFDVFGYPFLHGGPGAIKDPAGVILTERAAIAIFGTSDVMEKDLMINNSRTAIVKAVLKDIPGNSTLQFDGIIPINPSAPQVVQAETEWVNCGERVFFKTNSSANIPALESKVLNLIKEKSPSENPTTRGSIVLHPMSKWRLYEEFKDGKNTGGRIEYVQLFSWIALIILVIACVNFINLSTAKSERRAREVGIRKTLGSMRRELFFQFIIESMLLSIIAFVVASLLVISIIPVFSSILNQEIKIPYSNPAMWVIIFAIITITGFMAGSYPAFYLSGFNPVKVLKGSFLVGKQGLLPRKILVTSQFIVSIVLISSTLVIYSQLQFVKKRDIGYDASNLLMVSSSPEIDKNFEAFKNDLLQTGKVAAVNRSSTQISTLLGFTSGIRWKGGAADPNLVIGFLFANSDFAKTIDAKLIEGRDFKDGDSNRVLLNREAVRVMKLNSGAGQNIHWAGRERTVVGVIDNIIMTSPYEAATPLMIAYDDRRSGSVNIRLNSNDNPANTVGIIEGLHKKYSGAYPFDFHFADDEFNAKFLNEELIGKLALIFAGVAIFICCLGLFGLVASSIEKRKKEIGVRKVLGASVQSLLLLMSKEFLKLVGLAFLIAIPIAWWSMSEWLQNYTYRVTLSPLVFVVVGFVILLIALVTVSLNASKAALSSPVKTLRNP